MLLQLGRRRRRLGGGGGEEIPKGMGWGGRILNVQPAGGLSILDIMHHTDTYYGNICVIDYASHLITRAPPL